MTEQRPPDMASLSAATDVEPMHADFHDVAESPSHDHTHLALIYETQTELFANAVPFLQAGLDRGEQCLYIADETPLSTVVEALETAGIDVEAACAAGDLSLLSSREMYGGVSEFDAAAMVETWENHIIEAIEEGYEGFRIAGEATWELGTDGLIDGVRDYESQLTECFAREDCLALCMYNRERFPAAVLDDVLQHHSQVVADGTVMQNVYYIPPDEEHPQQTVERKLQTLRERTTELKEAHHRLEVAATAGSIGTWMIDVRENCATADARIAEYVGLEPDAAAAGVPLEAFYTALTDGDPEELVDTLDRAIAETGAFDHECRCQTADGDRRWVAVQGEVEYDANGEPLRVHGTLDDITNRKRQERLQDEQTRLLELIAADAPLDECLSTLCSSVARLNSRARANILLTDEARAAFHRSIAPDLRPVWGEELEGAPINDLMIGTCGEAAFRNEPITCEDIANDDRWSEDWRELCLENGILAGHSAPIRDEDSAPIGSFMLCFDEPKAPTEWERRLADFGTHIASIAIERDQSNKALSESEERQRLALESGAMGAWELDLQTNTFPVRSPRHDEIFGYEDPCEDWSVETLLDHVHPDDRDQVEACFEDAVQTGDWTFDCRIIRADDEQRWITVRGEIYNDEGEPDRAIGTIQDITDHKRANDALEHLNDTSRELMNADTQAISEQAAGITQEVLDVPYASLWRYDEATGDLQLQTVSTASGIGTESIRYPEKFTERAWQTFVSTELDASNEFPPASDTGASEESIRSGVIVPLGRHGVICAGSLSPGAFDETTVDLAETVAATIETALDRAAHEQELAHQNEELTRLDRLNSIIREIDQALVAAETREEIDRVVCEQLSASDLYEFAWMGETDPGTDTIVPREWAGIDPGYLDQLTITTDDTPTGQGPIGTALRTRDPQVVQDIITAARFAPWREHTLEQGVRSCISIPLVYNDTLYGVVTVYAEDPLTNERHHDVLAELGETVANAISSVETKQALQTDSVVELKIQVREPDTILSRLAQQVSCQIEFEGLVSHSAETAQVFITTHGASADEICTAATASLAIETVTTLSESEDGCRIKLVVTNPPLASVLIDQDAEIRQLTLDGDGATAVVALPTTRDVRSVIETVQTTFPETELISRRTCPRSHEPLHTRRAVYEKSLTDRQQDTLRTAYLSGFFESPRETTGQEIAEAMDVSQPTFVQHLRAGQRNLFEMLFDGIE